MRNDVKPVRTRRDTDPADDVNRPAGEGDFDREHGSGVRRERGDSVDPAGPKRSQVFGALGSGGAVTDPSGTTGTVSRSSGRGSTTTGKLGDRELERSARQGEAPDVDVLPISTADSSMSVPVIMAVFAVGILLLALILILAWPSGGGEEQGGAQSAPPPAEARD